jgi:hypothetical protein
VSSRRRPRAAARTAAAPVRAPAWGVDDRDHLVEVVDQQPVEQRLVAVEQALQVDVALEIVGLALVGPEAAFHLHVDGRDAGTQQAVQLQAEAFLLGERRRLVEQRVVEELLPAQVDLVVLLTRQRIDLE